MSSAGENHSFTVISAEEGSSMGAFSPVNSFEPQKQRVSRACEACKIGHLSCDNERPCQRCVKAGKGNQCIDSQPKKRGKRRKRAEIEVSKQLESFMQSSIPLTHENKASPFQLFSTFGNADDLEELVDEFMFSSPPTPEDENSNFSTNSTPEQVFSNASSVATVYQGSHQLQITSHPQDGITPLFSDVHSSLSKVIVAKPTRDFLEKIHRFIVERGWMSDKESKQHLETAINLAIRKSTRMGQWTEEQRRDYEKERQHKCQQLTRSTLENSVPTILRDESAKVLVANDAYKQLSGVPESIFSDIFESMSLFHYSAESMRIVAWSNLSMMPGFNVIPCFARVWTNSGNYRTENIHGHDHMEGTAWITRYTDNDGNTLFTTISFMPSPRVIR